MTAAFVLDFAPAAPELKLSFERSPVALAEFAAAYVGPPGPPGPQGIQGPVGDAGGALLVTARLSEFISEEAKADARANIGLAVIDGGTFF